MARAALSGFDAGGRFLDLSGSLAPDKFTAEVRKVAALPVKRPAASIAWSKSPRGPFQTIWEYDPRLTWKDGIPIDRTLRWPEVDRHVDLSGARDVYVRYRIEDMGLDSLRGALETQGAASSSVVEVTHIWKEDGVTTTKTLRIPAGTTEYRYTIEIPRGAKIVNDTVIFECK